MSILDRGPAISQSLSLLVEDSPWLLHVHILCFKFHQPERRTHIPVIPAKVQDGPSDSPQVTCCYGWATSLKSYPTMRSTGVRPVAQTKHTNNTEEVCPQDRPACCSQRCEADPAWAEIWTRCSKKDSNCIYNLSLQRGFLPETGLSRAKLDGGYRRFRIPSSSSIPVTIIS